MCIWKLEKMQTLGFSSRISESDHTLTCHVFLLHTKFTELLLSVSFNLRICLHITITLSISNLFSTYPFSLYLVKFSTSNQIPIQLRDMSPFYLYVLLQFSVPFIFCSPDTLSFSPLFFFAMILTFRAILHAVFYG